jgi:hypothetical protein
VLNDNPNFQARGFWYDDDWQQHITCWKELRAVGLAIEYFLPQLQGRSVLLHEDNTTIVATVVEGNHTLPRNDIRVTEDVALTERQRHQPPTQVHSLGSEHMGRQSLTGSSTATIGS